MSAPDETDAAADAQARADLEAIPKIPYARGLRLSGRETIRIAMLVSTLVLVLVMQKPCSQGISAFVTGFDTGSGAPAPTRSAPAVGSNGELVHLKPGMTDAQMKQQIDSARAGSAAD